MILVLGRSKLSIERGVGVAVDKSVSRRSQVMMMDSVEINQYKYKRYKRDNRVLTLSMPNKDNKTTKTTKRRRFNLRIKLKKRLCIRSAVARCLKSWRSLAHALRSLLFKINNKTSTCYRRNRNRNISNCKEHRRQYSYCRSNSFYAEAIAECLEFIKRSSNVNRGGDSDSSNNPPLLRPQC